MARKKKNKNRQQPESTNQPNVESAVVSNTTELSSPNSHLDKILMTIILVLSAGIYIFTMWPTVGGGDSGELIAASYTLGIIHPPGYPLFIWSGKLLSFLPFGSVAWRINLVSVLYGLGSIALLFLVVKKLAKDSWAAFLTSGLFAFSPLIWRYSIIAEVFTINNFFILLLLYLFLKFCETPKLKTAAIMALAFGLGLCNHHTLVFFGLPMAIWMLWRFRELLLKPKALLLVVVSGLVGLLPYAHLAWASSQTPLVSWGDASTWNGFLTHLLRREYGTFKLASEGTEGLQLFYGLSYYGLSLLQHLLYIGIIPLGFGLYSLKKMPKGLEKSKLLLILGIVIGYLVIFHYLANLPYVEGAALYKDIVSRFWPFGHILFFVLFGWGWAGLLTKFKLERKSVALLSAILIIVQIAVNFAHENQNENYTFLNFGKNLLKPIPPNAIFFTLGDVNTNTVRYLQNCENFRTDVKVMDRSLMSYGWFKRIANKHYPDVVLPGLAYHPTHPKGYNFEKIFDANFDRHKIYLTFIKTSDALEAPDQGWQKKYRTIPYGLSFLLVKNGTPLDIESYMKESENYLVDPYKEFPELPPHDSWDSVIKSNYWLAHHLRAAEILRFAMDNNFNQQYLKVAAQLLGDLITRNPSPAPDYFKNKGIAHHHLARVGPAEEKKQHEAEMLMAWKTYVERTERRDKTYNDIVSLLKAYGQL